MSRTISRVRSVRYALAFGSLLSFLASAAGAQDEGQVRRLDDSRAVRTAMASNPTLRAAVLDLQRANESVRFEDGRYPYTLQLDAGVTRSAMPRVSGDGVEVSKSDSVDVGAELSRTFATGTRASLRVEGYRDIGREPVKSGPGYGTSARASVTQPLMRGAGVEVGEQQLRVARINRTAAELSRDRVASEVAREVLLAYWELWYAEAAVGIEGNARDLAKRQRDEAQQRVDDGALAPVEVLPFETRVASLEESVVSAQTDQRRRSLALAQRMGTTEGLGTGLAAEIRQQPAATPMPLRTAAVEQALANSPEIKELEAQLRLTQEQIRTSGDAYRPRLDLEGYVQVAGLGNQEIPPAFEQMATARATSVHVGVVYELPLDDARKSSERARDLLAMQVAEQRLLAARQRIQTEVETLLEQERAARIRLQMAEKTAEIAAKQVAAATERFEIGVAIPVEVQLAEDELRKARLRAVRARIDLVEAEVQRDHATGRLLTRVADQMGPATASR
jgi:outer membrane protein TolC